MADDIGRGRVDIPGETRVTEPIYYEDQRDWEPADYYALFRYLNRLLLNQRAVRTTEIASLDLSRMSAETKHLLKHMLVQKKAYERVTSEFPNLAGLDGEPELEHPLYLSGKPLLAYDYFTEHRIYL
ncbi:MAG: hypothetical protein JST33_06425 [Actinobacteria bacterium]|nr:hypothetical protein [Actinomycetota bacterium]